MFPFYSILVDCYFIPYLVLLHFKEKKPLYLIFCIENLALGRPTWEQFPWIKPKQNWGSKNAVDGSYNERGASGNQCTISDNYRKTAEWRVDLGDIVSISHIDIYYRTDNFQSKSKI